MQLNTRNVNNPIKKQAKELTDVSPKKAKIYNGEKTISLTSGAGKAGKRMRLEHFLTP